MDSGWPVTYMLAMLLRFTLPIEQGAPEFVEASLLRFRLRAQTSRIAGVACLFFPFWLTIVIVLIAAAAASAIWLRRITGVVGLVVARSQKSTTAENNAAE